MSRTVKLIFVALLAAAGAIAQGNGIPICSTPPGAGTTGTVLGATSSGNPPACAWVSGTGGVTGPAGSVVTLGPAGTFSVPGPTLLVPVANDLMLGVSAGNTSLTGTADTCVGYYACNAMTIPASGANPQNNTVIGSRACLLCTTVRESVVVGADAAMSYTGNGTGVEDGLFIAIGSESLSSYVQASGNTDMVCIGQKACLQEVTGGFSTVIGNHGADAATRIADSVMIGHGTADQTVGATLTREVVIGRNAGYAMSGSNSDDVMLGWYAGNAQTNGGNNVLIGSNVARFGTNLQSQTCVGFQACYNLTESGGSAPNTVVGYMAGSAITTGGLNTLLGVESGQAITTSGRNTFIGSTAGVLATGSLPYTGNNTALGDSSCFSLTSGTNATCIGQGSNVKSASGNYETVLGASATGSGSSTVTLGRLGQDNTYETSETLSGGAINFVAVPAASAPTAGTPTSGGSCTAGAKSFKLTFVNQFGESLPSSASSVITCVSSTGQTVPIAGIQVGPSGTTGRNLYATVSGNTGNYLLACASSPCIANNTATTFSFTLADGSLGAAAPSSDTSAGVALQVKGSAALSVLASGLEKAATIFSAAGTPLPTCNAAATGLHGFVSDAANPTIGGIYTSSGSVYSGVVCNGANWVTY